MSKCVFPGSFNPFTLGHRDIVVNALKKYDEVIVAVANETYKEDMLSLTSRVMLAEKSLSDIKAVRVIGFRGLLTDFLVEQNVFNIVRGLRRNDNSDYERSLSEIYKQMDERTEVEYFYSDNDQVSSSLVRSIVKTGGSLKGLVSAYIIEDIKRLYS